jgi:hypothetical protein
MDVGSIACGPYQIHHNSIPPISIKRTYDVEIPGPWLGEACKCGGDKPVNGVLTLPTRHK